MYLTVFSCSETQLIFQRFLKNSNNSNNFVVFFFSNSLKMFSGKKRLPQPFTTRVQQCQL